MSKEEFVKQRCEIDKITEEEFERTYRVVECNCGKIYCKGYRCLDLDGLLKENQELKKQLEDANEKIILLQASEPMLNYKKSLEEIQQKEFIKYLEDKKDRLARECSNIYEDSLGHTRLVNADKFDEVNDILQKYKEMTGEIK